MASLRQCGIHEDILRPAFHLYVKQFAAWKVHHEPDDREGPLQRPEQVWYPHVLVIREVKVMN